MKNKYIKDFEVGNNLDSIFALRDLSIKSGKDKTFLTFTIFDKTGSCDGVIWENVDDIFKTFKDGDIVSMKGKVSKYNEQLQFSPTFISRAKEEQYDIEDLIPKVDNPAEIEKNLIGLLSGISNIKLKELVKSFLTDEKFMKSFRKVPAGKGWHHATWGGLLQHTYEVVSICNDFIKFDKTINKDLLLVGAFLHDCGKVYEFEGTTMFDYSLIGRLMGHIVIGNNLFLENAKKVGLDGRTKIEISHLLLSHHGELESGAPVLPVTLEACVISHADNLSAQANAFSMRVNKRVNEKQVWSQYYPNIGRYLLLK